MAFLSTVFGHFINYVIVIVVIAAAVINPSIHPFLFAPPQWMLHYPLTRRICDPNDRDETHSARILWQCFAVSGSDGLDMGLSPDKIARCACAGNAENVFPHGPLQRKPLVSDPGMHHGTCVTHVPWCMSGSLTRAGGKTFPAFPAQAHPQFYVSGKRPM